MNLFCLFFSLILLPLLRVRNIILVYNLFFTLRTELSNRNLKYLLNKRIWLLWSIYVAVSPSSIISTSLPLFTTEDMSFNIRSPTNPQDTPTRAWTSDFFSLLNQFQQFSYFCNKHGLCSQKESLFFFFFFNIIKEFLV